MKQEVTHYTFAPKVCMRQVDTFILLAVLVAECLHGREQLEHDLWCNFLPRERTFEVESRSDVGQLITRLVSAFLARDYGQDSFTVSRADVLGNSWEISR
jgi:hypothetical protein